MATEPVPGFAGLLQHLRTAALLTQEELAEAARLSPRSVSDLERGINRTARKDTAVLLGAAQGWTHLIIGRDGTLAGAHDQSRAHQLQALDHFRRAGDLPGQAWALLLAGFACAWKGDWAEAGPLAEQALALFWQTGDQAGQGWALAGLGHYHVRLGNYDLARGYARQALEVTPQDGDPAILAFAGDALGLVHSGLGEPSQAINCYRRALDLVRERRDPLARGIRVGLLIDFGDACRGAGDLAAAAGAWRQAQQILRDLGLPENPEIRAWLNQAGSPNPPS